MLPQFSFSNNSVLIWQNVSRCDEPLQVLVTRYSVYTCIFKWQLPDSSPSELFPSICLKYSKHYCIWWSINKNIICLKSLHLFLELIWFRFPRGKLGGGGLRQRVPIVNQASPTHANREHTRFLCQVRCYNIKVKNMKKKI